MSCRAGGEPGRVPAVGPDPLCGRAPDGGRGGGGGERGDCGVLGPPARRARGAKQGCREGRFLLNSKRVEAWEWSCRLLICFVAGTYYLHGAHQVPLLLSSVFDTSPIKLPPLLPAAGGALGDRRAQGDGADLEEGVFRGRRGVEGERGVAAAAPVAAAAAAAAAAASRSGRRRKRSPGLGIDSIK